MGPRGGGLALLPASGCGRAGDLAALLRRKNLSAAPSPSPSALGLGLVLLLVRNFACCNVHNLLGELVRVARALWSVCHAPYMAPRHRAFKRPVRTAWDGPISN